MEEIQVLNTLAIDHIEQEDYEGAIEILSFALTQLAKCSPRPAVTSSEDLSQKRFVGASILLHPLAEEVTESEMDFFASPYMYVFRDEIEEITNDHLYFCAMILLFNLGVTCHCQWSQTRQKNKGCSPKLLLKALRVYDQAYALSEKCSIVPQDSVVEVLMAICTNASHINLEIANIASVKTWNARLCRVLHFASWKSRDWMHRKVFLHCAALNSFGWAATPAA